MALEELIGYPYKIWGPYLVPSEEGWRIYGWGDGNILPTTAPWLCYARSTGERTLAVIVLMDEPRPPTLPAGWEAQAYKMRPTWASDDGAWLVKAITQRANGSWVFCGYRR